nr:alpha-amylase family protein [Nocardioides perillae]
MPDDLPAHRREVFEARVQRWWPDLVEALTPLYPEAPDVAVRLVETCARRFAEREDELHHLDLERSLAPDWFQRPDALGYAAYAERFGGTLRGVADHLDHLGSLGVTYLHLMPLLDPRPGDSDGGYAVRDYRRVREDLGTMADLRELARALRARGISLCLDVVLNHVAREHAWAERARAGEQRYRDYFHVFPDRTEPDRYEQTLPEVFPDSAPGSFTFDVELDGWVWTTFNHFQWDVRWANPAVLEEYADVLLHLANQGAEVFRLDAIAFTWKRLGTNCQNQPEVHCLTQALRTLARIACPAVVFKAEAIVGPDDLLAYLGEGRHHGKVSDLAYHNALMVHLWSMLASRDAWLSSAALGRLGTPPSSTAWVTYARCHDDVGWAISDEDAATAGVEGSSHRRFLSDFYDGSFPGSWARGLVFQANPATGDKRISGSLASLAGVEAGDPHGVDRVLLAHAVTLGFGGLPVIWMGDEVGLLNDPDWADDPTHAGDERWVHRPRMTWPVRDEHGVLPRLRHLLEVRRSLPHLHASTPAEVLLPEETGVFTVLRRHPLGPMLGLYGVTPEERVVPWSTVHACGLDGEALDHVTGQRVRCDERGVVVAPYGVLWLTRQDG